MKSNAFTVVTACLNHGSFLRQTIESVLQNLQPGDQYIIIDGGSSDNSVDIIRQYADRLHYWVSEKDTGYADAIAKGFEHGSAPLMCWINSGDLLLPGALDEARKHLVGEVELVFGDDFNIDENNRVIQFSRGFVPDLHRIMLFGGWTPLQDACYWTRSLYERVGGLDRSLRYAADYDLFLRMSGKGGTRYLSLAMSAFRTHVGQKSIAGRVPYRLERETQRRQAVKVFPMPVWKKRGLSLYYWVAVRFRARWLSPHRWTRPDLAGANINTLKCAAYWPAAENAR